MKLEATYEIASVAGHDAGNANMHKHGRKRWSEDDFNEAVRVFNLLYPDSNTAIFTEEK